MVYVILPPQWLRDEDPSAVPKQLDCSFEEVLKYNELGYNVYYYPNHPSEYGAGRFVKANEVDVFNFVFVDLDMKHGAYESKEAFTALLLSSELPPSVIVDSGGGIHGYWAVDDLDAMSFLRLSRRLCSKYNSDPAVCQIKQLMRVIGTVNNKEQDNPRPTQLLHADEVSYTCEDLDKALPRLTQEDEEYCKSHYDKAYSLEDPITKVDDKIPLKFAHLIRNNAEAKDIWAGNVDDRSKGDYRLGHIMFADGFSKDEAMSVLVNSAKALSRAPTHRVSYAENIVDKIWTFELEGEKEPLSSSVRDILCAAGEDGLKGARLVGHRFFDNTVHGFRLGQVIGLCAGVGVGKTTIGLNLFKGFVEFNPDYDHMIVPLEQPAREIAERWKKMCGDNTRLHDKVHVMSNYTSDGTYRRLSLHEIQDYIITFQKETKRKIGCVVIDHIGVLKKETRNGENQGLMEICQEMKAFAVSTNTLLVMQTQSNREKAGIGDIELDKDAAYGTQHFESFCDFLITAWQPLKRCYDNPACPRVTAYKFCKIRFKNKGDKILEDQRYRLMFEPDTETLSEMVSNYEESFRFFNNVALNLRTKDKKSDLPEYSSIKYE